MWPVEEEHSSSSLSSTHKMKTVQKSSNFITAMIKFWDLAKLLHYQEEDWIVNWENSPIHLHGGSFEAPFRGLVQHF